MGRICGTFLITLATLYLFIQTMECGVIGSTNLDGRFNQLQQGSPEGIQKRPFCNAFTGCGKKRSSNQAMNIHREQDLGLNSDNSIGALLDLNSEPAVEDLVRQIMSEAKLWEAIQEANHEMINDKIQQRNGPAGRLPVSFSTQ